jgi:hypothetical protein
MSAITQKKYDELISATEALMRQAHKLGLHRPARKLHTSLNEARGERFEAQPKFIEIRFDLGAVETQPTK